MLVEEKITYHYITSEAELIEVGGYLDDYVNAHLAKEEIPKLAVDVETFSNDKLEEDEVPRPIKFRHPYISGMIKTLQIGMPIDVEDIQFIIDLEEINPRVAGKYLKFALENSMIIGQNLKYEFQMLAVHCDIRLRNMRDLMLMSQVLHAGNKISHSMGSIYQT